MIQDGDHASAGVDAFCNQGHLPGHVSGRPFLELRIAAPDDGQPNSHRHELLLVERHRAAGRPEKASCRGLVVVAGEELRQLRT